MSGTATHFSRALRSGTATFSGFGPVIGLLCSAITVFVYVRIIVLMYFTESTSDEVAVVDGAWMTKTTVAVGALLTLVLGVAPSLVLLLANNASQFLR